MPLIKLVNGLCYMGDIIEDRGSILVIKDISFISRPIRIISKKNILSIDN